MRGYAGDRDWDDLTPSEQADLLALYRVQQEERRKPPEDKKTSTAKATAALRAWAERKGASDG